MGTNYYAHINPCEHCGKAEEKIHIGKSNYGWTFSFHSVAGVAESWREWQKVLQQKTTRIVDEYGETITFSRFKKIVEKRSHPGGLMKHAEAHPDARCYLDADGQSFSQFEFC